MGRDDLKDQLFGELRSFGIGCSSDQADLLLEHMFLVLKKNEHLNLTRIIEPTDAVTLHIVDSLVPLSFLPMRAGTRFLDLGTGGGYPGIPLAIMTQSNGVLLDSVGKKVAAVNEFIQSLSLDSVTAEHARVEDFARAHSAEFDFVFARAVAQSNVLIEYASPLLKIHGLLVLEKARPTQQELDAAQGACSLCGMSFVSRETTELPRDLGHREILIYEKTSAPKLKLPRQAGLAKKEPLGL